LPLLQLTFLLLPLLLQQQTILQRLLQQTLLLLLLLLLRRRRRVLTIRQQPIKHMRFYIKPAHATLLAAVARLCLPRICRLLLQPHQPQGVVCNQACGNTSTVNWPQVRLSGRFEQVGVMRSLLQFNLFAAACSAAHNASILSGVSACIFAKVLLLCTIHTPLPCNPRKRHVWRWYMYALHRTAAQCSRGRGWLPHLRTRRMLRTAAAAA
jgi:hypothetical protein